MKDTRPPPPRAAARPASPNPLRSITIALAISFAIAAAVIAAG